MNTRSFGEIHSRYFEMIGFGIVVLDREGFIELMSKKASELFTLNGIDSTGQRFVDYLEYPPDFFQELESKMNKIADEGLTSKRAITINDDKLGLKLEFNAFIFKGKNQYLCTIEQIVNENASIISDSDDLIKYKELFENAPIGQILIKSKEIILVNETFANMYGYSSHDELIGKNVNLIQPTRLHSELNTLGESRELGENVKTNYKSIGLKSNVQEFPIEVHAYKIDINSTSYTLAYIRDMTIENHLISQNKMLNIKFQQALEIAPLPIMLRSLNHKILFINTQWTNLSGYNIQDIPSVMDWVKKSQVPNPSNDPKKNKIFANIDNQLEEYEEVITTKMGDKRVWKLTSIVIDKVITDQEENIIMTLGVDVTEFYNVQKKLEESNTKLEDFAHVVSHDLREPLRKISGFTQILQENIAEKLNDENSQFLNLIVNGASRMQEMITGILKYASISSHTVESEFIDLGELLEEIINLDLSDQINEKAAQINLDLQFQEINGYKSQIRQLFQNLLTNAIKFVAPDEIPMIYIKSKLIDPNLVEIVVTDNGIGVAEHQINDIFKMFKRIHPKEKYGGTGIGLAICKKVVENHHGEITVESEINRGSRFKILLPIKGIEP